MNQIKTTLIALLVIAGWSNEASADLVQPSTQTDKPEHVYRVHCARQNTDKYWSNTGAPVSEAEAGSFVLLNGENEGDYYIYNLENKEYVSYVPSNIGDKRDFSVNVTAEADRRAWKFNSATTDGIQFYEIQPYNANNTAERYVNWYGGLPNNTHNRLGLWRQNGTQDKGSTWTLVEIDFDPSIYSTADAPKYYTLKNLRQNKYADNQTEGASINEVSAISAGSIWRFEDATSAAASNLNEGIIPCYIFNEYVGKYLVNHANGNTGQATYSPTASQVWYLIPHTNNKTGYVICKNPTMSQTYDSWNDYQGRIVCSYKGDDAGSIWQYARYFGTKQTYTIHINMPEGYTGTQPTVTYSGKAYSDNETFVGFGAPAASAFSPAAAQGCYPTVSISGNDINVTYTTMPDYTVFSDGMPSSSFITVNGQNYSGINAQGETTIPSANLNGLLTQNDITVTCGGGNDYKVIVDNIHFQITVNFVQAFQPTASVDAAKQYLYRIKDKAGRYPKITDSNINSTKNKVEGDKFIFVEHATEVGQYYIYNVTNGKYLYYTQTTSTNAQTATSSSAVRFGDLTDVPANGGATWKIRKESYSGETVDIYPATGNGANAWNFCGGGDSNVLNLFNAGDNNSSWTLEDPEKGSLKCATYMFALPGAQYIHKLIPEPNVEVRSITSLTKDGEDVNSDFQLRDDRVSVGNRYKYVTGHAPTEEGVYTYKAMLSDETAATITLTVSSKLPSATPFMGWLSWNWFAENINEERMSAIADGMVSKGLVEAGYKYLVLDDGWGTSNQTPHTDKENLKVDTNKFPNMKSFATSLNSKGIRLGLYSDAGKSTCGGFQPGSYNYETQHVQLFDDCGADFLKYDFCASEAGRKVSYQQMGEAIRLLNAKRKAANPTNYIPFAFNACEWGGEKPWEWAAEAGADSWRATQDARECWIGNSSGNANLIGVVDGVDKTKKVWMYAGVNRFNDLDMMCIGIHGYGGPSNYVPDQPGNGGHIKEFTPQQARSQMSLWCMLSSPLAITADVRETPVNYYRQTLPTPLVTDYDLSILKNKDIISISQDELGQQAEWLQELSQSVDNDTTGYDVYIKDLKDGEKALAVFNRGGANMQARTIDPTQIYFKSTDKLYTKDVWAGTVGEVEAGSLIQIPSLERYETYVLKLRTTEAYVSSEPKPEEVIENGLTYQFKFEGKELHSEQHDIVVGKPYPDYNQQPFGLTIPAKPSGNVEQADTVVVVNVEWNLPFKHEESIETATGWYQLRVNPQGKNNSLFYDAAQTPNVKAVDGVVNDPTQDKYLWTIVGNPFTGFKLFNKLAGNEMALQNTTPCKMTREGLNTSFSLEAGYQSKDGQFSIIDTAVTGGNKYLNGNYELGRYSKDGGSTFALTRIFPVDGDVNADGKIDVKDVEDLVKHLNTAEPTIWPDVDTNKKISIKDITELIKKLLNANNVQ